VVYLKAPHQNILGGTEENHEVPQSRELMSRPRFELDTGYYDWGFRDFPQSQDNTSTKPPPLPSKPFPNHSTVISYLV
jgi:hypothetical protein